VRQRYNCVRVGAGLSSTFDDDTKVSKATTHPEGFGISAPEPIPPAHQAIRAAQPARALDHRSRSPPLLFNALPLSVIHDNLAAFVVDHHRHRSLGGQELHHLDLFVVELR
jgi:hypothetical protein